MRTNKFNFTKEGLERLEPIAALYEVIDTRVEGLRLRVLPGGTKTFNLLKKINGRKIRYKIGRFPETSVLNARTKAIEAITKYNAGENLNDLKSQKRNELTFSNLWKIYYMEHALKNTKCPEANKKMLDKHVFAFIGNDKISLITKDKIKNIHTAIWNKKNIDLTKKINYAHADRIITVVSSVFNFGIKEGYFKGSNPCVGVKKFQSVSRDRFLSHEELKSFFDAVEKEENLFRDFFKLLLFTGARKSNVLSMKWADLDLKLSRWRIPETQTKNKDVNIVVLSQPSLEILSKRKTVNAELEKPSIYVVKH